MKFVELYLPQKLWLLPPPSEVKFCVSLGQSPGQCSYSMRHKLSLFNMLHRTYYTPDKLHKMNCELSFLCWRCKKQKGTSYQYVLVLCLLTFIWDSLIEILTLSLNMLIPKLPRLCLLGTNNTHPWTKFNKKYIDLAFIAVIKCIRLPFIGNWITHLVYPNG